MLNSTEKDSGIHNDTEKENTIDMKIQTELCVPRDDYCTIPDQHIKNAIDLKMLLTYGKSKMFQGRAIALLQRLGYIKRCKESVYSSKTKEILNFEWLEVTRDGAEFGGNVDVRPDFPPVKIMWDKRKAKALCEILHNEAHRKTVSINTLEKNLSNK